LAAAARTGGSLVPVLVLVIGIGAGLDVLLPSDFIQRTLGDVAGTRGILSAWLAGALTPGGGPMGLPFVATLARHGASLPVLLTYLISMSTLSILRIPMEWALLGGRLTALRYLSSLLIPPIVGLVALAVQRFRP
jgi:uncharacterized membrane protein YraQ (UPF0718 family)